VYFSVAHGERTAPDAVWSYPNPTENSESIRGHMAFYPHKMDSCTVDGEEARRDSPRVYGFTSHDVVGPFKGEPGTEDW